MTSAGDDGWCEEGTRRVHVALLETLAELSISWLNVRPANVPTLQKLRKLLVLVSQRPIVRDCGGSVNSVWGPGTDSKQQEKKWNFWLCFAA